MTCESPCKNCSTGAKVYEILTFDYPTSPIAPGDVYTINARIKINGLLGAIIVCLYDIDRSVCISSTQRIDFWAGGYADISISGIMGNTDLHLNLSVVEPSAFDIFGSTCEDNKYFTIRLYVPPESKWSCDASTKTCYLDSNSTMTKAQCDAVCSGAGGGVACTSTDMNIMGMCIPKPVVFLGFALAAIYMFKGK